MLEQQIRARQAAAERKRKLTLMEDNLASKITAKFETFRRRGGMTSLIGIPVDGATWT